MSRAVRLQPLLQLAEQQCEDAGRDYAAALQQVRDQEQRLTELHEHRREYSAGLAGGGGAVDPRRLHQYRLFLERLDEAIEQQSRLVERCRSACSARESHWQQRRQREEALSTMIERQHEREREGERRAEQRAMDEFAARKR